MNIVLIVVSQSAILRAIQWRDYWSLVSPHGIGDYWSLVSPRGTGDYESLVSSHGTETLPAIDPVQLDEERDLN